MGRSKSAALEELKKEAKDSNVGTLNAKLKMARLDLDKTRKELSVASTEIYNSRRKQALLSEDLAKLQKTAVSEESRRALSDAWESLLSLLEQQLGPDELEGGFNKLGAALRSAGFWQPDGDANEAAAQVSMPEHSADRGNDVPSPCSPEPPLARLRSETDLAESKNLRLEKKHKSEKSAKKEKKGKRIKGGTHIEDDGSEDLLP